MIDKITDITKRLGSAFLTTSRELFARQYAISDEETIEQGFWRSTVPIEHNHDERLLLFEKIMEKKFCPGGRILAGAGTSHRNTLNCFVLAPNSRRFDYLDDVEDLVLKVAATTKVGGGIGINFDPFASVQYAAPVDIEIWHTMDPDHPDYSDFVGWQYTDITAYGQPKRRYDRRGALIVDYSEREAMSAPIIVVEDSISAIFRAPFDAVRTGAKRVILDWSNLRPEGAEIKGSGGTSSGAASFAIEVQHIIHWLSLGGQTAGPVNALRYVFQPVLRSVRQGGTRRGAGMATLSINHPDAEIFLSCKDHDVEDRLGEISAFNISFLARDEDMDNPFLEKVAKHAWLTGDPGLLFVDTINRDNPLAAIDGYILSTNPCGEIPLYPGEPCDLGAINLLKYVAKNSVFNASEFANDVGLYVRYLDGNLDYAILPTEQSRIMSQRNRRIGLGVMGLAHALIKLGLRYGSQKGREAAWKIFRTMAVEADQESVNMSDGKQRMSIPFERHNIALLTVAPTGTTSMIMDVSSGIEPIFSVTYRRKIGSEDRIFLDPLLMEMLREHDPDPDYVLHEGKYVDWDEAKVVEAVQKNGGSLRGLDFIPKYMQDLFQTSHEIHYRDHIAMQAAAQDGMNYRHVGNSISKTINMPHSATVDDVLDAYRYAHSMGCKGITIYRDGSRMHQVLNTDTEISLECPTGVCEL